MSETADNRTVYASLVNQRRSVRKYKQNTPFDHEAVARSLELALLSPNSSNMQLWEFHRVIDTQKIQQAAIFCMGQNAAKTARELVFFVTTPNKWPERAKTNARIIRDSFADQPDSPRAKRSAGYYEKLIPMLYNNDRFGIRGFLRRLLSLYLGFKKPMIREVTKSDVRVCLHKSTSLAAMNFMMAMAAEGYDTCPMEGFDSKRMKKLLKLPQNAEITMVVSCGERADDGVYGERNRVDFDSVVHIH